MLLLASELEMKESFTNMPVKHRSLPCFFFFLQLEFHQKQKNWSFSSSPNFSNIGQKYLFMISDFRTRHLAELACLYNSLYKLTEDWKWKSGLFFPKLIGYVISGLQLPECVLWIALTKILEFPGLFLGSPSPQIWGTGLPSPETIKLCRFNKLTVLGPPKYY